jgi:hypothetical protein
MRPDQGQVEVKMMDYMSHQKNFDGEQTAVCCSAMFKRCLCCTPKKALKEERLTNENALRVRAGQR